LNEAVIAFAHHRQLEPIDELRKVAVFDPNPTMPPRTALIAPIMTSASNPISPNSFASSATPPSAIATFEINRSLRQPSAMSARRSTSASRQEISSSSSSVMADVPMSPRVPELAMKSARELLADNVKSASKNPG
jgi:hypothetical protein